MAFRGMSLEHPQRQRILGGEGHLFLQGWGDLGDLLRGLSFSHHLRGHGKGGEPDPFGRQPLAIILGLLRLFGERGDAGDHHRCPGQQAQRQRDPHHRDGQLRRGPEPLLFLGHRRRRLRQHGPTVPRLRGGAHEYPDQQPDEDQHPDDDGHLHSDQDPYPDRQHDAVLHAHLHRDPYP